MIWPPRALIAVVMSASDIDFVLCDRVNSACRQRRSGSRTLKAILSRKWLTPELDGVLYRASGRCRARRKKNDREYSPLGLGSVVTITYGLMTRWRHGEDDRILRHVERGLPHERVSAMKRMRKCQYMTTWYHMLSSASPQSCDIQTASWLHTSVTYNVKESKMS